MALREMRQPSLLLLLDYLDLLADVKLEKLPVAALRWHSRLEQEGASTLTLPAVHRIAQSSWGTSASQALHRFQGVATVEFARRRSRNQIAAA